VWYRNSADECGGAHEVAELAIEPYPCKQQKVSLIQSQIRRRKTLAVFYMYCVQHAVIRWHINGIGNRVSDKFMTKDGTTKL